MSRYIRLFTIALTTLVSLAVPTQRTAAQLSGNYTVGGDAPDYATLADAADALITNGVDGPVVMRVRSGTYVPAAGGDPVLSISEVISGTSPVNTVTFEPDVATGATVASVILRNTVSPSGFFDGSVVEVRSDFVTIRQLTLEMADDSGTSVVGPVVSVRVAAQRTSVSGIRVEGCRLHGALASSTAWAGVHFLDESPDAEVVDNTIHGAWNGVVLLKPSINAVVSRNLITGLAGSASQQGQNSGIYAVAPTSIEIHDNVIDYRNSGGGSYGIGLNDASDFDIRSNQIIAFPAGGGLAPHDTFVGINIFNPTTSGGTIANNMIANTWASSRWGIRVRGDDVDVLHNTVYHPERNTNCLFGRAASVHVVDGQGIAVKNNILVDYTLSCARTAAMLIADTTDNVFDANSFFAPGIGAVHANGTKYFDLLDWQNLGYGPNSIEALPEFVSNRDLHLGECSVVDDTLRGIPVGGVSLDLDGDVRDLVAPFRGADEPNAVLPDLFDGPSVYGSGASSFDVASGDLDDDGDNDLAVANLATGGGSNNVRVFWNDGAASFNSFDDLAAGTNPRFVRMAFMNADDVLDLVVQSDDGVFVRFGIPGALPAAPLQIANGSGGEDLEVVDYDGDGDDDVFILTSSLTDSSIVIASINDGDGTSTFLEAWKIAGPADDMVISDVNGDDQPDIVTASAVSPNVVNVLFNTGAFFDEPVPYSVGGSSTGALSTLRVADFDGDLARDIVLEYVGTDSLILMRNLGDGSFGAAESFYGDGKGGIDLLLSLDYESDGDQDLLVVTTRSTIEVLLNNGTAQFTRTLTCRNGALGGAATGVVAAVLDDNESPDVVVLSNLNEASVLLNLEWTPSNTSADDADRSPTPAAGDDSNEFVLGANYPNPTASRTTITYSLSEPSRVMLEVFDLLGRRVATLVDGDQMTGRHSVVYDVSRLSAGTYFYRLSSTGIDGPQASTRQLVVIRQ